MAEDIMSENVAVIYEDMLVSQVAHLMLRDRVSGFPVVNKGIGMVGIITMTDLFSVVSRASSANEKDSFQQNIDHFKNLKVAEIMTRNVISIQPSTTLNDIVSLVVEHGIHFFPVIEDDRMVGIVSRHDILNAIFSYD